MFGNTTLGYATLIDSEIVFASKPRDTAAEAPAAPGAQECLLGFSGNPPVAATNLLPAAHGEISAPFGPEKFSYHQQLNLFYQQLNLF